MATSQRGEWKSSGTESDRLVCVQGRGRWSAVRARLGSEHSQAPRGKLQTALTCTAVPRMVTQGCLKTSISLSPSSLLFPSPLLPSLPPLLGNLVVGFF